MELLHSPTRESASKFPQTPATVYLEFLEHEEYVRWKTTLFDVRPVSFSLILSREIALRPTWASMLETARHEKPRYYLRERAVLPRAPVNRYRKIRSNRRISFRYFTHQDGSSFIVIYERNDFLN